MDEEKALSLCLALSEVRVAAEYKGPLFAPRELADNLGVEWPEEEGQETDEDAGRLVEACRHARRNLRPGLTREERIRTLASAMTIVFGVDEREKS